MGEGYTSGRESGQVNCSLFSLIKTFLNGLLIQRSSVASIKNLVRLLPNDIFRLLLNPVNTLLPQSSVIPMVAG